MLLLLFCMPDADAHPTLLNLWLAGCLLPLGHSHRKMYLSQSLLLLPLRGRHLSSHNVVLSVKGRLAVYLANKLVAALGL